MIYATYEYYTTEYNGTVLTAQEFPRYAKKASAEIDHFTFGRLSTLTDEEIPTVVRDAMCDVAEFLYHFDTTAEGGSIASESNDGYSISYRDSGGITAQQRDIQAILYSYLAVTGLMYRGVPRSYDIC